MFIHLREGTRGVAQLRRIAQRIARRAPEAEGDADEAFGLEEHLFELAGGGGDVAVHHVLGAVLLARQVISRPQRAVRRLRAVLRAPSEPPVGASGRPPPRRRRRRAALEALTSTGARSSIARRSRACSSGPAARSCHAAACGAARGATRTLRGAQRRRRRCQEAAGRSHSRRGWSSARSRHRGEHEKTTNHLPFANILRAPAVQCTCTMVKRCWPARRPTNRCSIPPLEERSVPAPKTVLDDQRNVGWRPAK